MKSKPFSLSTLLAASLLLLLLSWTGAGQEAPTRSVRLKLDVDLSDPRLQFVLDDGEIPAKMLQAPLPLRDGGHELMVLRDGQLIGIYQFDVGAKTGPEIGLKRAEPPPGDDEPDFRPGLPANAKPSAAPTVSREELRRRGEWVPLFNRKDRSGWRTFPKIPGNWLVENGVLVGSGKFGPLFTVEDDWTDVHLRIEARSEGGGTGVCRRAPFESKPGRDSYHVFLGGKLGTGSLRLAGRDLVKVKEKAVPPDSWFTLDVIVRGHHIVVKVDGKVVAEHDDEQKTCSKGHLVLEPLFAAGSIHYRRVEARDLAAEKLPPKIADKNPALPSEKVSPKTADYGKHVVHVLPLAEPVKMPHLMIARAPRGGFRLGWNAKGGAHVTSLSEDLKPQGAEFVLPQTELRGLGVTDDGTIAALVFRPPCEMHALGLSRAGRTLFDTPLSGQFGSGPGTHFATRWFWNGKLVATGKEFAVHFGHFVHTKGGSKHQGGYFARLDDKGTKLQQNAWTVSHSIDQALFHHQGDWLTASVGDAFPIGIPFINRSQKKARSLIYPPKDQRDDFHPKMTHLSRMVSVGDDVALAFTTRVGESWQAFYVVLDKTGEVKRFVNLPLKIPPETHAGVNLARYGADLLLLWTATDTTTGYVPIDSAGRFLGQPTLVDEAMGRGNDLALFANGDVGWLTGTRVASEVKLVRVRR